MNFFYLWFILSVICFASTELIRYKLKDRWDDKRPLLSVTILTICFAAQLLISYKRSRFIKLIKVSLCVPDVRSELSIIIASVIEKGMEKKNGHVYFAIV